MGNEREQRIVFCPQLPLLIAGLSGQRAPTELLPLQTAVHEAIQWLTAGAERLTVVGPGAETECFPSGVGLTTSDFGTPIDLRLGAGPAGVVRADAPTSLLVAASLLAGLEVEIESWSMGAEDPRVVDAVRSSDRVLVMGDGSARRRDGAPGYVDERAVPFDDAVAQMLDGSDVRGIRGLDVHLADQLLVAGVRPWQAAAEAVGSAPVTASLDYYDAPYGVAYFVARWSRWT